MASVSATSTRSVGIAGASGYAGLELQRLLRAHPLLEPAALQARSEGFEPLDVEALAECDLVFLALPHGASRPFGEALVAAGTPVVDLGSDFRLDAWTYGLPELDRRALPGATAVANPGCYAAAAILAVAPLAEAGLLDGPVALTGLSGVSGAGRAPSERSHLPDLHGGVTPYAVTGHRHIGEIEQALGRAAGGEVRVSFTPHLLPTARGALVTAHVRLRDALGQHRLDELYEGRYEAEPFVRLGGHPAPQRLAGSNVCWIAAFADERTSGAVVCAALDNLVKGAAGQAIQNANLMLGLDETLGLPTEGLWPV